MMLSASVLLYRSSLRKQEMTTNYPYPVMIYSDCLNFNSIMINAQCVELHPLLQLPGDVLILPLSQVGDDDSRVEGACVSPHPQLLDGLLLEVQESYIVILLKTISRLMNCHHIINIPYL